MWFRNRLIGFIFGLVLFLMMAPAVCGQERVNGNRPGSSRIIIALEGTVRVSGAWALYPMMVKWADEFRNVYPKVRVDISAGGAGKGVTDALVGLVNVGMVSREITQEEVRQGAFYVPVVKDAVFPMMSDQNPVFHNGLSQKGIKKKTFIDLWIKGRDMTWGEIAGSDSKYKVHVYTRSDSCGAAETWAQYLGGKRQEDLQGIGVYGDPGLAEAVRKDPLGTGYNNLNYTFDFKTGLPCKGLRVVPVDLNENGKIDPEEDLKTKNKAVQAIASGVYPSPLARNLYLLTKNSFKGLTREFVRWILTDGQKYVDETGYIPLTKIQVNGALKKLEINP
ncbi:MAG: substrate-binding domain-containing protein [Thermodesulfobacteriota bacterium]|jgi:phosphate transport system substrate-binding protein